MPEGNNKLSIDTLLILLTKALQYGIPVVLELIINLRGKLSADPTPEEIHALVSSIRRPGDYPPSAPPVPPPGA